MFINLFAYFIRWGTANESSDFDFLVVVSDEYDQPKIGNVASQDDIDIAIISLSNFKNHLCMYF